MVSLYELASPSLRYPECVHGLLKQVSFGARRFSIYYDTVYAQLAAGASGAQLRVRSKQR